MPTTPSRLQFARFTRIASAAALLLCACGDPSSTSQDSDGTDELEFHGEQAFLPGFDHDTGWLPEGSPVAVRATVTAAGGVTVDALATTDGDTLMPVAGSGALSLHGSLALEVSARIDTNGVMYEGVVDSFEYAIEPSNDTFDPFALDAAVTVASPLPAAELGRVPIPSVPGATLVLDITGGEITTEFQGTCADASEGYGQYAGTLTMEGIVGCAATIEIEIPFVGTMSFGPFPFDVPIPAITTPIDLGTHSLTTGEAADAMGVCDIDAGSTTADTSGSTDDDSTDDGPLETGDEGTSEGSDDGSSSAGTDDTGDPTGCSDDTACPTATEIGEVFGDEISTPLQLDGAQSTWVTFLVAEGNDSVVGEALLFSATLTSPPGYDFDLYVYRGLEGGATGCGGELEQSTSTNANDFVEMSWGEGVGGNAQDDSAWVAVEIVAKNDVCDEDALWMLTIDGGL